MASYLSHLSLLTNTMGEQLLCPEAKFLPESGTPAKKSPAMRNNPRRIGKIFTIIYNLPEMAVSFSYSFPCPKLAARLRDS